MINTIDENFDSDGIIFERIEIREKIPNRGIEKSLPSREKDAYNIALNDNGGQIVKIEEKDSKCRPSPKGAPEQVRPFWAGPRIIL